MPIATNAWRKLIERLHLLNRVHNSPDFETALFVLRDAIDALGFRGRTRIVEYPAGGEHNYWRVPQRWIVNDFYLEDVHGTRIVDKSSHPLVLTPFSKRFEGPISRDELLRHIHWREDLPTAIPFIFRRMYRHWKRIGPWRCRCA